jgi:hypothetical protein
VTEQQASTRIGRRSILVAILAVAAVIGAGIGLLLASVAPPGAAPISSSAAIASASLAPSSRPSIPTAVPAPNVPAGGTVLELNGTGNLTSDAFAVEPGWQVVWQTEGTHFSYAVHGAQDLGTVVDVKEPSSGANAFAPAGTFRIEVAAQGPWSIKVVQGGQ